MKPSEPYEIRLKMAEMHDTFLEHLETAMKKNSTLRRHGFVTQSLSNALDGLLKSILSNVQKENAAKKKGLWVLPQSCRA